ncbi:hypothetical protein U9R80_12050 [Pseudomonas sp. JQ170C]|uniref:hypothetical protein n=1 Tax=Pseudomonas sp. JQ170C TaxID=3110111 RepID=UPI002D799539|nr:hypothetical protein [Pseudomonas sp. 170C]WRO78895.1 hypothetical protein U9R80_12050 [Pseudomonas sp. 170C]
MRHLFADRRLTGIEGGLRRGKATAPDNGGENPEQFQVDIVELDHHRLPTVRHIAAADMNAPVLLFFPS